MSRFAHLIPQKQNEPDPNRTALFVGENALGGRGLGFAQMLDMIGAGAPSTFDETGWFKGPEGKWRREIDDSGAYLDNGELVHPELEKAYPGFTKDHPLEITNRLRDGVAGSFNPDTGAVMVDEGIESPEAALATVLHEYQHAVQQREGFARGGSPNDLGMAIQLLRELPEGYDPGYHDLMNGYQNIAGEMEAYGVEDRIPMSAAERRRSFPGTAYVSPEFEEPFVLNQPADPMQFEDTGLAGLIYRMFGRKPYSKDDWRP